MIKTSLLIILSIGYCLTLKAQPTAAFTADRMTGCSPLVVHFSNQTTGAGAAAGYQWDLGNGNTVVATNPQAIYTIPGSYTVTLTVTDGGQTSTSTGTVTVDQPPTVSFVPSTTKVCAPSPIGFSSTSVAGSSPIASYLWDFGDGATTTDTYGPGVSHPYSTAGVDGVSLTVTDADGCSSTKTMPGLVTILPALTASFTTPQTVLCAANSPVTFTNTSTGPGTLTYSWSFGDGGSSLQTSPTYAYTTKGTYTVILTVTSSVGCAAADTLATGLSVANYQTNFSLQATVCVGSPVSFTDNSSPPATQRNWLVDGVNIGTVSPQSYEFSTAGTHTVSLSNIYGTCPQTLTKNITVNALPVIPPFDMVLSTTCGGPETVNFLDHTPGAVKWAWIFYNQVSSPYPQDTSFGGPGISNVYATGTFDVGLTVTNAAGCPATTNQVLSIYPPVVDIVVTAGTPEACDQPMTETFGSGQLGNLASWTWVFGDGTTSTAATPTHTFTTPGSYQTTLQWTDKNGCSGTSNTLFTNVSPPLSYDFTASSPTTICAGQAVGFTGPTPFNQSEVFTSWFFGDGSESFSFNGAQHTYTEPGVYSVTLNIENVGCSASVVKTNYITVLPSPSINFTAATTCDSPRAAMTFSVAAGNGATGIAWQFGDGTTVNTGPSITTLAHTYAQNGDYAVNATATNGTCTTSSSVGIVIELKPLNFHLGINATTICPAVFLSDTLQEVFPPGSSNDYGAFSNVQWYYADGTPFVGPQNWVSIGDGNGNYTSELSQFQAGESGLYAVMTNLNGCKDTSNTVPLLIGGVTPGFEVIADDHCYLQPVVLLDTTKGISSTTVVSWDYNFGDGTEYKQLTSLGGTLNHLYASPGTYTVTMTVTDPSGCTTTTPTATGVVTVNGPQASFYSVDGNVLPLGSTVVFANSSNVYGATGVTYGWTFGDGTTSTDFSPAHVYGQPGTYTVTLTAQDATGGCVSTATLQVVIQPFNSAFQMSDSYVSAGSCPPVTVQFTNTSVNYASLLWNFGDGETATNVANPSHVYAQPGTYYVSLTVVNGAGQTLVTNDSVIVRQPSAVMAAPVAAAVCVGQADTLQATGGKEVKGYTWDFGDGTVSSSGGAGGSGGADSTITHVYTVAGLYTATLAVTDTLGCAAAGAGTVQVDVHAPPVAYVTPPVATMCLNGQVTLTANGGVTYAWSPVTGLSAADVAAPVASPSTTVQYTVTVADDIGCTSTQSIVVTVVQPETMTVTPDSTAICPGKTVTLQASGAERYQWIGATGGLSATDIANPVARPVDSTVYEVVGGDSTGCFSDTLAVIVNLLPQPSVSAGPDETIQGGTPVTLAGEATGDVVSWLWTPATYLSCTDCAQPVCTPKEPQQYIVTVTGGDGCTASDTVVVSLLCDESKVKIPDAFTPNGDGHNDRWNILGISEVNHLVIFNRWGEKVFERDHYLPGDADAGWDGTINGRPGPAGLYVYYAEMQCPAGGAFERRGTVVLVR